MPDFTPRGPSPVLVTLVAAAMLALSPGGGSPAQEQQPSELKRLAESSLLLGVARTGERLVAVGERGHVLLSDDEGATWTQVVAPIRVTLTAVHFVDDSRGCAVGHESAVIVTRDGGESWTLAHHRPGEDLPLLDVWVGANGHGFAVGAYGTLLRTADGGVTWSESGLELVDSSVPADPEEEDAFDDGFSPTDVHLNRLTRAPDGTFFAAGEAGHLFRSNDGGRTWSVLPSPYEGSFFGLRAESATRLIVVGLRGNAFLSTDGGAAWSPVETSTDALLTGVIELPDGRLVAHGLAGTLLVSRDRGATFEKIELPGREGFADGLLTRDGSLLLVGDFGATTLSGELAPLRNE